MKTEYATVVIVVYSIINDGLNKLYLSWRIYTVLLEKRISSAGLRCVVLGYMVLQICIWPQP